MPKKYIDANKIQWYSKWLISDDKRVFAYKNEIDNIPAADVEEVKHGEWIEQYDADDDPLFRRKWVCSVCGEWQTYGTTKRCPECGAKMDGKNGKG